MPERLRRLPPAELSDEQKEVYDAIAGGPRSVAGLRSPDRPFGLADRAEEIALRTVRTLLRHRDLDDGLYREASGVLGPDGLFELSTLVGYYATLALQLRLFRVGLPESAERGH